MSFYIPEVIIENDSLKVIQLLALSNCSSHLYEDLAESIYQLKEAHGAMHFQHTRRAANALANYMAQVGLHFLFATI